jgi:quercetin dioxygenase-like cupin family protein
MRVTRRDFAVATIAAGLALSATALAQNAQAILGPTVWDWEKLAVKDTDVGQLRSVVRQPTATLSELEIHVTTLNPGIASHPPHHHPNEEIVIVRTGTVEVLSGGVWKRLSPGSIIFNASNSEHALKNVGTTPATYDVINWKTPATPAN